MKRNVANKFFEEKIKELYEMGPMDIKK